MQSWRSRVGKMWKPPDRGQAARRHEDDEAAREAIGRIQALSDGVFAIAITLLILEIAVPTSTGNADLPKALLDLWPRYLAYALSFLVIARFWLIYHQTFRLITGYDTTLLWLNLLLLMFIAFLPFPTGVLGEHGDAPAAAVLYATSVGLASTAFAGSWWYASGRRNLLKPDVTPEQVKVLRAKVLSGPVFFGLTVPIAAFAPRAAEVLWIFAFPLVRAAFVGLIADKRKQDG